MPRLAVLRHQLGLPSEPFVLEQAGNLSRWEPVLVSRDRTDADLGLPTVALADRGGRLAVARHTAGLGSRLLTDVLREVRADAVLAHFMVEASCALPATRRAGVPLVTVVHGFDASVTRSAVARARKVSWLTCLRRTRSLAAQGELFLPVSDHLRGLLLSRGFPAERTRTHHLGIDLARIPAETEPEDRRSVVLVGRLIAKKGHEHLLAALELLPPDVRLVCVGAGPMRDRLEEITRERGLSGRVRLLGALDHSETVAEIARAAVLCLPSVTGPEGDQEGLGQVLLEAGALGRPVVASRIGGIPSAVLDGTTGALVPEADPPALAAALARYLDDPDLARTTGEAARRHVQASFDSRQRTADLETALDGTARR